MERRLLSNIESQCPCCNSNEILYEGGTDYWDGGISYYWTCNSCGIKGREDYIMKFAGQMVELAFQNDDGIYYDYIDVEQNGIAPDTEGDVVVNEKI